MTTYFTLDPEDYEEMFEHIDVPQELDFDDDDYVEIDEGDYEADPYQGAFIEEEDYDEPYYGDNFLDDAEALASAGWGTDEDYGYFGGDEY